jgi:DNA-binding NtrC family response regulator
MTRLVIIDDDEEVLSLMCDALGYWYETVGFSDVHDAIAHLEQDEGAVILCDQTMPRLSGLEIYERLPAHLRLRFILCTGDTRVRSPSGHRLLKPCSVAEIRGAVSRVTGAPVGAVHSGLEIG